MQSVSTRIPVWLIILYILAALPILAWPLIAAFVLGFGFDAPGSADDPAAWRTVIIVLSYPLLPIVGVIGSIIAYKKRGRILSYILVAIGAIPLALIVLAFGAAIVSSWWYTLTSRF